MPVAGVVIQNCVLQLLCGQQYHSKLLKCPKHVTFMHFNHILEGNDWFGGCGGGELPVHELECTVYLLYLHFPCTSCHSVLLHMFPH